MRAVPHRGDFALRRARAGLVLEQHQSRRTHRHAFRRADALDLRQDLPNNAVDTIDVAKFIAPACVIDCSTECAANADFLLTVAVRGAMGGQHGRSPGSWVLLRTDWSKRSDPSPMPDSRDDGAHTPGPDAERGAVSGRGARRHRLRHGDDRHGCRPGGIISTRPIRAISTCTATGRFGLQCLTNLDLLPPTGAVIIAAPLKIQSGSGSPLRVLALVDGPRK